MTTTETATVEVLTAEVRVLQLGRRQITLSVFRQLDIVDPDDIEPFGRVNDGGDYTEVAVVGRCVADGALVRSHITCAYGAAGGDRGRYGVDPQDSARLAMLDRLAIEWKALPLIVLAGLR